MNFNPGIGVPFNQAAPMFMQHGGPGHGQPANNYNRNRRAGGRRPGRGRGGVDVDLAEIMRNDMRNRERLFDNLIMNPPFWATVLNTLRNYPNIDEEIRRDLEQQERRAALARERRRRRQSAEDVAQRRRSGDEEDRQQRVQPEREGADPPTPQAGVGVNDEALNPDDPINDPDGYDRPPRRDDLPGLYEFLSNDLENLRRTVGVQRLSVLLDELDVEALWSARDVTISFGALAHVLLRLFIGPYATDEENLIVRMLNLGVERAARNFGFEENRGGLRGGAASADNTEPFYITYRRRGRVLRDYAAFRYVLQITENMGRISNKNKNDLILLYLTLTTPEVRLHRKGNTDDAENVLAFRDHITGHPITTPQMMARPMSIEMHLDSVFGNLSANARMLERSLAAAFNNRNRKLHGMNAVQEVESLMDGARLLDLPAVGAGADQMLGRFAIKNERSEIRNMLVKVTEVSMMAEEYRVYIASAPSGRTTTGGSAGGTGIKRPSGDKVKKYPPTRRSIFLRFKPQSQATEHK